MPISGRHLFLLVMVGPGASLLAAAGLGALAAWQRDTSSIVFWCLAVGAGWSLYAAVGNSVPLRRWPRWQGGASWDSEQPSDGWIAFQVLKDGLWREILPGVDESLPRMTAGIERAVVAAGRAARVEPVGTQHLLAGLARDREGVAARVLRDCGFRPVQGTGQEAEPSPQAAVEFTRPPSAR